MTQRQRERWINGWIEKDRWIEMDRQTDYLGMYLQLYKYNQNFEWSQISPMQTSKHSSKANFGIIYIFFQEESTDRWKEEVLKCEFKAAFPMVASFSEKDFINIIPGSVQEEETDLVSRFSYFRYFFDSTQPPTDIILSSRLKFFLSIFIEWRNPGKEGLKKNHTQTHRFCSFL